MSSSVFFFVYIVTLHSYYVYILYGAVIRTHIKSNTNQKSKNRESRRRKVIKIQTKSTMLRVWFIIKVFGKHFYCRTHTLCQLLSFITHFRVDRAASMNNSGRLSVIALVGLHTAFWWVRLGCCRCLLSSICFLLLLLLFYSSFRRDGNNSEHSE